MRPHTRRAVAYIAGRLVSGREATAVYDYSERRYVHFSGEVSEDAANVYDYEERCHIGGSLPSLFHYGNRRHIQCNRSGTQVIDGFDYDTNRHFNVNVSGQAVSVYDYEHGQYFNYSV
jgi:hypothetical protein